MSVRLGWGRVGAGCDIHEVFFLRASYLHLDVPQQACACYFRLREHCSLWLTMPASSQQLIAFIVIALKRLNVLDAKKMWREH